ncbi:MAG: ribonuclease III [Bacilli bacterium]|nr:ribonuclease III [Bacilli bacterium]
MDFLKRYGIKINNTTLLEVALTHSSYANEHAAMSYERLEFLGDAILEAVSSEYFYNNTNLSEGEMSKLRASYVCEAALCEYSKEVGIDKCIRVGHGQEGNVNETIIADCFESVIGAIFLDQGFDVARSFILKVMVPFIISETIFYDDYKSVLQEMVQTDKKSLEYRVIKEEGPAHQKYFEVEVLVDGIVYGVGSGSSKKQAEQNAAKVAYEKRAR